MKIPHGIVFAMFFCVLIFILLAIRSKRICYNDISNEFGKNVYTWLDEFVDCITKDNPSNVNVKQCTTPILAQLRIYQDLIDEKSVKCSLRTRFGIKQTENIDDNEKAVIDYIRDKIEDRTVSEEMVRNFFFEYYNIQNCHQTNPQIATI